MTPRDSLEKIIIVADHRAEASQHITSLLTSQGFSDVRKANSGEHIYELLRPLHDQPDKLGLIIINENLPQCRWLELCQNLAFGTDSTAVPCIVIGTPGTSSPQDMENALFCRLPDAFKPEELLLSVMFLLKLKHERFLRHKQEEQLINELAAKSIVDAKLKFLVAHDELTGLFNRSSFERQFRLVLNLSNKLQKTGALLFIDVDRFSLINELEGFEVGDRLLVELTLLIRKLAPPGSLFARIGADEFCLFLENKSQKQAIIFAESVKTTVENFRFFTGEVSYGATVSIGIAALDNAAPVQHPGEMILHARQACNFAKLGGRDKIRVYNSDDTAVRQRRNDIYWVPLIRKALRENDLLLMFQPVVQLTNGNISHYEVLLRMRGDNDQIIGPDKFIPAAERMGLIHAIDLWVVENAIEFLAALPSYMSYVSLAINLSGTAFQYPDLLQVIREKLELTWVDASRLTFEITETAAVDNFDLARSMISKIRSLGCKFALDDFGAGFCSFNYLKTFPVDYLKIDGQFIRNLVNDETDQILVKSMVDIAARLGKQTIAEFVETPGTALKLKEIGVNLGQGYAFGRPERNLLESQKIPLSILLNAPSDSHPDTVNSDSVKQYSKFQ
ncbi:MAG: EAL domain-containing protein [Methylomonas sp.]|nr:EAL domain-containing protein [Methylomonas sp.]PPD22412.1 MAG: GGDEF-domain containing protein [Methylomonas sp.]PPD26183.1 MAG: GGDEF-domain containing protein [Methylomonas sp.]PPD37900.1 MAG: GGDEF-domain containing protein [Methylomonas sp.]PPD42096.1 MAG: GGDEF-domain containing protein [Methylomonas sp.]